MPKPSRRSVIKAAGATALGAGLVAGFADTSGAAAASTPRANGSGILWRTIPSTGERVPAMGLGTFMTFDRWDHLPREDLRQVLTDYWNAGGRVVDVSPLYGLSEKNIGELGQEMGINRQMFVSNKLWATGPYLNNDSAAVAQREQSLAALGRDSLDVVQVHNVVAPEMQIPVLRRWKQEKKIRMLGITHHDQLYYPVIEHWIRNGDLDFVQIHYSIQYRGVEERLLKLCQDHGTAVMVHMALEKARLHEIVGDRRLPRVARDIGAESWAQFFLKYVLAHPAVTVVNVATTNPRHLADNWAAMRGPLPDRGQRREMIKAVEDIPGFRDLQTRPWYPGKRFDGQVKLG
ncbi:aldo/keto reductase [Actinosynnema sp. NPDC059335]|uniref:aldo/keto reductase n=1 Tax=Actinosynnema sp. NPDC059335 TaxID=3346804 RepID=UPI003671685A